MELNYLRDFLSVIKYSNFSRAAEETYTTQSTLSKHIKALETQLGAKLFERTPQGSLLTEYGASLKPIAESMIELMDQIQIRKQQESGKKLLRISSFPSLLEYGITDMMLRFHEEHPDIELVIMDNREKIVHELSFANLSNNKILRNSLTLVTDEIVVLLPKNHHLAQKKGLSLSQLEDLEFLMTEEGVNSFYKDICRDNGIVLKLSFKGNQQATINSLISGGMGCSLTLRRQYESHARDRHGIVCIPLIPAVTRNICLVQSTDAPLSEAASVFWSFVEQYPFT